MLQKMWSKHSSAEKDVSLPNIRMGRLDQIKQEAKNIYVTHEDMNKRVSKKERDDLLSEYFSEKWKLDL